MEIECQVFKKRLLVERIDLSSGISSKGTVPRLLVSLPFHCFETRSLKDLVNKNSRRKQAKGQIKYFI